MVQKGKLSRKLKGVFKYDTKNIPIDDLQEIRVFRLVEVTEYDYKEFSDNYSKEIGQKFQVRGKRKMWIEDEYDFGEYSEMFYGQDNTAIKEAIGRLEVSGNTIIIKDEKGNIAFVFPADKFYASAEPASWKTKVWIYVAEG